MLPPGVLGERGRRGGEGDWGVGRRSGVGREEGLIGVEMEGREVSQVGRGERERREQEV